MREKVGGEKEERMRRCNGREKETRKEARRAAGRRTLGNGLKGTSVRLIALIFTRLADGEERGLDGSRTSYIRPLYRNLL